MMQILGLFILVLALFTSGASSATFTFKNKCHHTVWPATLTGGGSTPLSSTGFRLKPEATFTLSAASTWSGRFWGRTGCSQTNGKFQCATGDCASGQISCSGSGAIPPATLAEFSLGGYGDQDFYDVSLVDGFNLPLSITPQGGAAGCQSVGCPTNINAVCPPELSVKSRRSRNIACRSACDALKDPRYCCSGAYGTPTTCPPTPFSQSSKRLVLKLIVMLTMIKLAHLHALADPIISSLSALEC